MSAAASVREKLFALNRLTSEYLTDFLRKGNIDEYGVRANEFDVFCAFWVTASYLRHVAAPDPREVENFNRAVIVNIVDRIMNSHSKSLNKEKIDSLSATITNVFVERFSGYRESFQSDLGRKKTDGVRCFPRLGEDFLTTVLDKPVPEHSSIRQLLDSFLNEMLEKSAIYLAG